MENLRDLARDPAEAREFSRMTRELTRDLCRVVVFVAAAAAIAVPLAVGGIILVVHALGGVPPSLRPVAEIAAPSATILTVGITVVVQLVRKRRSR